MMAQDHAPSFALISQALRHVPLFAGLPQENRACMCWLEQGVIQHLIAGEPLVRAGDKPDFVVMIDGCAMAEPSGQLFMPSAYFGAMELVGGSLCPVTIRAVSDVTCFVMQAQEFTGVLGECHLMARRLLADAARQLRG